VQARWTDGRFRCWDADDVGRLLLPFLDEKGLNSAREVVQPLYISDHVPGTDMTVDRRWDQADCVSPGLTSGCKARTPSGLRQATSSGTTRPAR
jgi:hypothetical protein